MIGAGIFALLGEAAAIAGSAVWISFLLGGAIALLSGYSFGKLGARYPAAGGVVEYLVQGFGVGRFSGAISVMMYIAALVAISLVARTFGSYAFALMPEGAPSWLVEAFAGAIILIFMFVNLDGARSMARLENIVVLIKMSVLVGFIVIGMVFISPERLSPRHYPPVSAITYSVAVTFFAYEGFRIITNAAEDMQDPGRTHWRDGVSSLNLSRTSVSSFTSTAKSRPVSLTSQPSNSLSFVAVLFNESVGSASSTTWVPSDWATPLSCHLSRGGPSNMGGDTADTSESASTSGAWDKAWPGVSSVTAIPGVSPAAGSDAPNGSMSLPLPAGMALSVVPAAAATDRGSGSCTECHA
jgi:hypothetical protein